MDSTIVAALISGGVGALGIAGTVVTSVVGSRSTQKATEQAIAAGAANTRASLAAAREDKLWDKRAAAYEETLADLLNRQTRRRFVFLEMDEYKKMIMDFLSGPDPQWFQLRVRMTAYGSDEVLEAFDVTQHAHLRAKMRFDAWRMVADDNTCAEEEEEDGAFQEADKAFQEAQVEDDALIKVIRDELRSRPEAALPPPALPAVRRGLLRRHRG